jgi:hypothetical protein
MFAHSFIEILPDTTFCFYFEGDMSKYFAVGKLNVEGGSLEGTSYPPRDSALILKIFKKSMNNECFLPIADICFDCYLPIYAKESIRIAGKFEDGDIAMLGSHYKKIGYKRYKCAVTAFLRC